LYTTTLQLNAAFQLQQAFAPGRFACAMPVKKTGFFRGNPILAEEVWASLLTTYMGLLDKLHASGVQFFPDEVCAAGNGAAS
jgi:hypothetical protein